MPARFALRLTHPGGRPRWTFPITFRGATVAAAWSRGLALVPSGVHCRGAGINTGKHRKPALQVC